MKSLLTIILSLILVVNSNSQNVEIIPFKTLRVDDSFFGIPINNQYQKYSPGQRDHVNERNIKNKYSEYVSNGDFYANVYRVLTNGKSIYDLQSNGSPMQIWQDRERPQFLHAVYMVSPFEDSNPFPLRRTRYYFSSDYGDNWVEANEIPNNIRSGFPVITGLSNGRVVISNHYISGPPVARTFVHIEQFPQLNTFITLNPGLGSTGQVEWPRITVSDDTSSNVKINLLSAGINSDSSFYNYGTSLNTNQFSNWKFFRGKSDESYSLARSESGKIGIAYINNEKKFPADHGDVFYMESGDEGITFGQPVKIFDANLSTTGNKGLGGFRGVSIIYSDEQPRVVFETVYQEVGVGYFPGIASNIRYWTPNLPGSNPNKSKIFVYSLDVPFFLR